MSCTRPLTAWRTNSVNPETGKRQITFSRNNGFVDMKLRVACGKCEGCLKKLTKMWALRCVHENLEHKESCFITLTYDDEHLPADSSLDHSYFQKFMKRLRKKFPTKKIRYFMCGEYGDLSLRPHFHALLFGIDFDDKKEISVSGKVTNYTSDVLSSLWGFGFVSLGSVHYGTAQYVAKYSLKALGDKGINYEELGLMPEYRRMSNGIGSAYARRYASELELHDNIVLNGVKNNIPRYYENYLDPDNLSNIKDNRIKSMLRKGELSEQQLRALEIIKGKEAKLWKN
ncbi:replication initiator protein [Microviridae sp.]|nr:replication initiator protein [Microviridae sp.]